MPRVLHITNFANFGGGTEAAKVVATSDDLFLFLERDAKVCQSENQIFYLSVISIVMWVTARRDLFDIVHSHGRFPGFISRIVLRIPLAGKKFIHSFHGISSFAPSLKQSCLKFLEVILSLFSHLVIFNSKFEEESSNLKVLCNKKVLENGVSNSKIASNRKAMVNEGEFTLGFAATFANPKRHDRILELVYAHNEAFPSSRLRLIFCGDGPNKPEIDELGKKLLGHRYKSLGLLSDVSEFFSVIDGYIHFSDYESFGLSIAEAFANKIPVILNEGLPFSEFTDACFCVPKQSQKIQIEILRNFIDDSAGREQRCCAAYDLFKQNYSESAVREKYREIINAL